MGKKKQLLLFVVSSILFLAVIQPVLAVYDVEYEYSSVNQIDGDWNPITHRASEEASGGVYMIMLIFQYTGVSTSADSYGLDINYDGEYPNWIWDLESLKVEYRWGTSGTWTHLTYLDFWPYDGELSINDATNSVFQLRMRGCLETSDSTDHTWYFGEDPTLLAHYE